MSKRKCLWVIDNDYEDDRTYQTSCDHDYQTNYCCYCGKKVEESNEEVQTDT